MKWMKARMGGADGAWLLMYTYCVYAANGGRYPSCWLVSR